MLLTRARILTAALLLVSAGVFAVGVALERGATNGEKPSVTRTSSHTEPGSAESGGTEPGSAETGGNETGSTGSGTEPGTSEGVSQTAGATEGASESLLGINPESPSLVVTAVVLSVLLAVLVLTVGSGLVPVAVAAAMVVFTALDVREITHQLNESRQGLAAVAAVVALLHLLAALGAVSVIRGGRSRRQVTAHA